MADEQKAKLRLEIAHVLFMDIVGYSKLLTDEQSEALQELNQIVRGTEAAREAEAAGALTVLPTGDGMALVFTGSVEEPVECALEISQALRAQPSLPVRMGIHSGPIHHVKDANGRENIAGVGINIAQRVMDCGDAGHILVSKRVADDLAQQRRWQPYIHELGDVEVKHGVVVSLVNLYAETIGNPTPPTRLGKTHGSIPGSRVGTRKALSPLARAIFIVAVLVLVLAIMSVIFAPAIMRTLDRRGLATPPQPTATALPSLADTIKSAVAKQITDEFQDELSRKKNAGVQPPPNGSAIPEKSIAVLPFVNMSADKGDEYLSDGVSEELIAALSKITGLQVKARTSSFAFKGKNEDIQKIGELLHVSHLLEGSVAKAGNKLRITAQLIQASDGNHLWSDTYDREMKDIFAVRSEVVQQVAETLKIRLLGQDKKRLDKKPTENIEAYNLYRRGRYYADKMSQDGYKKALDFYQQAIEKDPRFALAYAGMADTYVLAADLYIPPREAFSKAKEAALKAIELDETLAEAHASLGFVHFHYDWDWAAAEKEFKRALALNPQSAQAHLHYTDYLATMGRFNEAYDQGRQALEIDPVSTRANLVPGWAFLYAGRIDDAIQQFSKAVELNPSDAWAHIGLGRAYLGKGMGQRAIEEMEVARRDEPDNPLVLGLLGYGYAVTGRRGDALKSLETLDEMEKKHYASRIARVYVYAGLGDKDKAFEWLEKAYQERSDSLAWFRKDPESKSLRSDPRFAVLMRKIGFTEP
jgi:TolB-like protein/Tfp pilus assembly protein PilF/class 3 adenylate cyclase